MAEDIQIRLDAAGLSDGVAEASVEIDRIVREDLVPAAGLINDAFTEAARSIESELSKAAKTGALSFKGLARSIAKDLSSLAIDSLVRKPVQGLVQSLFASLPFGGGRAGGGFVAPGGAFLVGERGPELFTPPSPGRISPMGGSGVTVNLNLSGVQDAESFRKSQTQIAASLSRAVSRGQRNL